MRTAEITKQDARETLAIFKRILIGPRVNGRKLNLTDVEFRGMLVASVELIGDGEFCSSKQQ